MLALVVTHLVKVVKGLDVVNQACQFSSGRAEHTIGHLCGHALYLGKQTLERSCLPARAS